jgi:hypothetical protein
MPAGIPVRPGLGGLASVRTFAPVRRLAAGIGLQQVVRLERRVDELTAAVDENAYLAGRLEQRVTELEAALVPMLAERHEWLAEHGREPDDASG